MKLLSIITKLPSYINDFYDRRPGLDKQPYSDQYGAIVNDNSNSFETWAAGMSNIGYQTERSLCDNTTNPNEMGAGTRIGLR